MNGVEAACRMRNDFPATRVILFCTYNAAEYRPQVAAGLSHHRDVRQQDFNEDSSEAHAAQRITVALWPA